MDQYAQLTYLVTLSHLRSWKSAEKNLLLIQLKDDGIMLSEFFSYDYETLTSEFMLTEKQADSLKRSEKELPKNAMMIEDMENRGFSLIDFLDDKRYPPLLKKNLDYINEPDYYKGDPNGGYRAYVWTDYISSEELVAARDNLEKEVRNSLNIPFNYAGQSIKFEHSMGQGQISS